MICTETVSRLVLDTLEAYHAAGFPYEEAERRSGIPYATLRRYVSQPALMPHPHLLARLRRWLQVPAYVLRGQESYDPPVAATELVAT